jgi:hypothetical protein
MLFHRKERENRTAAGETIQRHIIMKEKKERKKGSDQDGSDREKKVDGIGKEGRKVERKQYGSCRMRRKKEYKN